MSDHTHPMPEAEVLARAEAFDPTQVDPVNLMRFTLEVIARHCRTYDVDGFSTIERIQKLCEDTLAEVSRL